MIYKIIIDLIFLPINFLVGLLPTALLNTLTTSIIPLPLQYGANFFPLDLLLIIVGMFVSWCLIFMTWAVIEWVYKKIPGVD